MQVTAGLAVAESAYEFEHRDLHWWVYHAVHDCVCNCCILFYKEFLSLHLHRGNILLSRRDKETLQFTLDGRHMIVKTYGLIISIIDFTLSRINTGLSSKHCVYCFWCCGGSWQSLASANYVLMMPTGDDVHFLDLSSDPDLFKGPKGDKQVRNFIEKISLEFI